MITAGIPQENESQDTSLSNSQIAELSATRVLFFAGDVISPKDKYAQPGLKGFGGIFKPEIKTLGNKGMLYRCQLTALRPKKIGDSSIMLGPVEAAKWESGFVQENAVRNPDGTWGNKVINGFTASVAQTVDDRLAGQFQTRRDGFMVYKTRYPGEDIEKATERTLPHGVGGVVDVLALKNASNAEINAAQLFFFPNWKEIKKGLPENQLPVTTRELEEHINARMKAIPTEAPDKSFQYQEIGASMLQSCAEFRYSGTEVLGANETVLKESAAMGITARYPPICDMLNEQLEMRRKDELVSGESSAVDRLARALEKTGLGGDNLEAQKLELALLEAKNRAKELEIEAAKITGHSMQSGVPVKIADTDGDGIPDYLDDEPTVFNNPTEGLSNEAKAELKELETIAVHDTVYKDGLQAVVTDITSGWYKLKFNDGTETSVRKAEITK